MAASSQGKAGDTSSLVKPIELGSPTIIQLLNARTTSTEEVISVLERECDAILECRKCCSLFRSLANFISHKRAYCVGSAVTVAAMQRFYPGDQTVTVEPTDPDTDKAVVRSSKPYSSARRIGGRKARPVRKTVATDLTRIRGVSPPTLNVKPIEGVTCAQLQVVEGSEADKQETGTSSAEKIEEVTTVQPKDGYPNMNLRQRSGRPSLALQADLLWEDPAGFEDIPKSSKNKGTNAKSSVAEALSMRGDCDVSKLKCLACDSTFTTIKTLNIHMMNKHNSQRKLYPCIYCSKTFTQFWVVTRHLKTAHNLSGHAIDKVRESIRARVFSEDNGASSTSTSEQVSSTQTDSAKASPSQDNGPKTNDRSSTMSATKASLACNVCSKMFTKRQYLHLHMMACYKKSGLPPPCFKKRTPPPATTVKPLLFVCKTCNRAFSMRQNMAMHSVACSKRHRENELKKSKPDLPDTSPTVDNTVKEDNSSEKAASPPTQAEASPVEPDSSSGKSPEVQQSAVDESSRSAVDDSSRLAVDESSRLAVDESSRLAVDESSRSGIDEKEEAISDSESPAKLDGDDILCQLSPSDEAKEEERNQTPPVTPTSLALGRPKRNLKPKQFSDGTVSVRRKVAEVVRVRQADGSQVYKLRQDVEPTAPPTSKPSPPPAEPEAKPEPKEDIVKAKDTKGMRILIQGESVPLLDEDDEATISSMIDMSKLICLKCKRQYGSSSNLRRHAVRHLGWRRYKCKLCKFTSYNKSECKTHLRKSHHSEVSTLLDGGLAPFIIDLGTLLDEGGEDGKLNLSLPSAGNRRTRANSKEPCNREEEAKPCVENGQVEMEADADEAEAVVVPDQATGSARRKSGRARKQLLDTSSDSVLPADSPNQSTDAVEKSTELMALKNRSRARKQDLHVLADSEAQSPVDKQGSADKPGSADNKRPMSIVGSANADSEASRPKQIKTIKLVAVRPQPVPIRPKESVHLEGLVNKLRGRSDDNPTRIIKIENVTKPFVAADVVRPTHAFKPPPRGLTPPPQIPTTVPEAAERGDS